MEVRAQSWRCAECFTFSPFPPKQLMKGKVQFFTAGALYLQRSVVSVQGTSHSTAGDLLEMMKRHYEIQSSDLKIR